MTKTPPPVKTVTDRHGNTYTLYFSSVLGRYVTIPEDDEVI